MSGIPTIEIVDDKEAPPPLIKIRAGVSFEMDFDPSGGIFKEFISRYTPPKNQ